MSQEIPINQLINGEDNFLVDHLGNRIVAEGN